MLTVSRYVGLLGTSVLIPLTILLTVSFFVLVVARKIDIKSLKIFGYVLTVLLWLSTLLVVVSGVYAIHLRARWEASRSTMRKSTMMPRMQQPMNTPSQQTPENMPETP